MTKKEMKRFEKANMAMTFYEAKKHEAECRAFYEEFAKANGCILSDFEMLKEDVMGDGIPRCITVFTKKKAV